MSLLLYTFTSALTNSGRLYNYLFMKSTLKIALGTGNEPVIHLNIVPTDDIRDQLCCQFMHKLGGSSTLCSVSIQGDVQLGSPITHLLEISPLTSNSHDHYICLQRVEEIYKGICFPRADSVSDITMITGGGTVGFYKEHGRGAGIELNRDDLRSLDIIELVRVVTGAINSIADIPEPVTDKDTSRLPSRYQIEDPISTEDIFDGQVVAVRFTVGKTYYDILDRLTGNIIRDIDSCEITEDPIKLPQAPQPVTT